MFGYMAPASIGSNVVAAGVLKASADEFFFSSDLKENAYLRVSKASVNEDNYTGYYLKEKDGYVKQDQGQKFRPSKQYYTLSNRGSAYVYLNTVNAMAFVTGKSKAEVAALDAYKVANGGIYVNGELQYQPEVKVYDTLDTESGGKLERTVPKRGNLVSIQRKGEAIAFCGKYYPRNIRSARNTPDESLLDSIRSACSRFLLQCVRRISRRQIYCTD